MKSFDFIDKLFDEGFFTPIHSDMYWNQSFNADKVWEKVCLEAKKRSIQLVDEESFDYDYLLTKNFRDDPDKSLS